MCKLSLPLAVLAVSLVASCAQAADVSARVPSNFYRGTKWVLYRDERIPNPAAKIVQEKTVETPVYKQYYPYPDYSFQSSGFPIQASGAPIAVDHDTEIVESQPVQPISQPQYDFFGSYPFYGYGFGYDYDFDSDYFRAGKKPIVKVAGVTVTEAPRVAVHVADPVYIEALRKKKSVEE